MNKYIKSPLNYVGGKYKLLKEIIPLLPSNINTFVDLFGGGGNVCVNVDCDKVVYNDIQDKVVELLSYLKQNDIDFLLNEIDMLIKNYKLSKENQEGFNNLRNYYNNENENPIVFYTMICYAFNYQIRFNKEGKYNMPFGKNKSSFNPKLRENFIKFVNELHNKNILFVNKDFRELKIDKLSNGDFIYCDPPYFNSTASYNENGGWTEQDEKDLLSLLDDLNEKGIKFALSNNFKYDNDILKEWSNKYNIHFLGSQYQNCNYQKRINQKILKF